MSDNSHSPFDVLIQEISDLQEAIVKAYKSSSQLSESFSEEISSEEDETQEKVIIPSPFVDESESNDSDRYEPCQWFAQSLSHEEEDTDESPSILTLSDTSNLSQAEDEQDQEELDFLTRFKNLTFSPSLSRSNSFELSSEEEYPIVKPKRKLPD
jgi:hypothetical protein